MIVASLFLNQCWSPNQTTFEKKGLVNPGWFIKAPGQNLIQILRVVTCDFYGDSSKFRCLRCLRCLSLWLELWHWTHAVIASRDRNRKMRKTKISEEKTKNLRFWHFETTWSFWGHDIGAVHVNEVFVAFVWFRLQCYTLRYNRSEHHTVLPCGHEPMVGVLHNVGLDRCNRLVQFLSHVWRRLTMSAVPT